MSIISVLVPVYGVEAYIERCSRSLFEQTCSDLEYVFVDDCSPDRSIDVLRSVMKDYPFKEHCVKIIRHNKNRGLAAARNTLLDNATGEFVCFVDSDDWLEKDAIQVLIQRQIETDADVVLGDRCEHKSSRVDELRYMDVEKNLRILMNLDGNYMPFTGTLIRKSLFDENAIRCIEGLNMAEDVRMVCLLSYFANKVVPAGRIVYHYDTTNPNSVMHEAQDKNKVLRNTYENLQNKLDLLNFFSDKEEQYYERAVGMVVRMLRIVMKKSLKVNNRSSYYELIDLIENNPDISKTMQWRQKGIKSFFLHSFTLSKVDYQLHRIIKHVLK